MTLFGAQRTDNDLRALAEEVVKRLSSGSFETYEFDDVYSLPAQDMRKLRDYVNESDWAVNQLDNQPNYIRNKYDYLMSRIADRLGELPFDEMLTGRLSVRLIDGSPDAGTGGGSFDFVGDDGRSFECWVPWTIPGGDSVWEGARVRIWITTEQNMVTAVKIERIE
ncbi:MAG: hypothetical protein GY869_14595 [Planctomycetes bacterium]|nr:hypothetical protein [Planctomycetota bacterium]